MNIARFLTALRTLRKVTLAPAKIALGVKLAIVVAIIALPLMAMHVLVTRVCQLIDVGDLLNCSEGGFPEPVGSGCGFDGGEGLSPHIPRAWRDIIARAAAGDEAQDIEPVNPNYLAALFLTENGNVWKPVNTQWPESSAAAKGPMQFIDSTWEAYRADGDGDGVMDVTNPADALLGAANYVSSTSGGNVTPDTLLGTLTRPWRAGTLLYSASLYNAGRVWGENQGLSAGYVETQHYLMNIEALLTSDLERGGHPNYGQPRVPDGVRNTMRPVADHRPSRPIDVRTDVRLKWPVATGTKITAEFGDSGAKWKKSHTGTDFGAPSGAPIYAVADGTVIQAGVGRGYEALGQLVRLDHVIGGQKVQTWYAHTQDGSEFVQVGDTVEAGDRIGSVGSTGNVTGPHLHFEVHPNGGAPIDPIPWLKSNGATGVQTPDCGTDGDGESGSAVLDVAVKQEHLPYIWGGGDYHGPTGPYGGGDYYGPPGPDEEVGFDCSGLVQYAVYQVTHLKLPRVARDQERSSIGEVITAGKNYWKPGDLLFWEGHVAIYAGKDRVFHANNPKAGIEFSQLDEQVDALGPVRTVKRVI